MIDETPKVKIIGRETGDFPPPPIRKIYPTQALLWKYYFTTIFFWAVIGSGIFLITVFISFIDGLSSTSDFPVEFIDLAWFLFWISSISSTITAFVLLPVYVRNMEFIVHGDFVQVKKGLINRTVKFCPFRTVTNISTRVGPFDKLFGIGNVFVQTAGKSGQQTGPEEKLEGLRLYHEIRDYILKQLRQYYSGGKSIGGQKIPTSDKKQIYEESLAELKEIKQILKEKDR